MAPGDDNSTHPPPTPAATSRTYIVLHAPSDPGVFSGKDGEDVEDWISLYEHVSRSNRWDPTIMLANIAFYLGGTPRVWFRTHENELTSWDSLKQKLRHLFGNPYGHQRAAQKALSSRVQMSRQPYLTYIQDILALCHKAGAHKTESDKLSHNLKGIADDAFNLLVFNKVATVDAIIEDCRRLELAKSWRIDQQFARRSNTPATSSCADAPRPNNTSDVTRIVRREMEAAYPAAFDSSPTNASAVTGSLIQAVVPQEFENIGLHTICSAHHPDTRPASSIPPRPASSYLPRFRNPSEWCTANYKPICFHCHQIGHISRHCRSRWSSPTRSTYTAYSCPQGSPSRPYAARSDNAAADCPAPNRPYSRSPSPQRRQSRTPQPRRSYSPTLFGRRFQPQN
ncbi:uncharacterized protein [Dermacentor albipictus]|uniref:uncharacterized protein n=1 Tax=Dermacentor albipictus TaxID=60249 RepID=UPI0038FCB8D7